MNPFDFEQQAFVNALMNQRNAFANEAATFYAQSTRLEQQLTVVHQELEALKTPKE